MCFNMVSCMSQKDVFESPELTDEFLSYYDHWLEYPNSIEQYCQNFYKCDSIDSFEFITEFVRKEDSLSVWSYNQYLALFDSFVKAHDDACFEFSPKFYLLKYRDKVSFNDCDSAIFVKGNRKYVLYGRKLICFLPYFEGTCTIDSCSKKAEVDLRKIEKVGLYNVDRVKLNVCDEELGNMQKSICKFFQEDIKQSRSVVRRYVVLYGKDGKMKDMVSDRVIPANILYNVELKRYLDEVLNKYDSAFYVRFCIAL